MRKGQAVRALLVLGLVTMAMVAFAGVALAQEDGPDGTVVAEGFNGPMGLLIDDNGDLWVIDSGMGGEEEITAINPEIGPISATVGNTSRIAVVSMDDGSVTDVAAVASYGSPEGGFTGGARLAVLDGVLYASVGDWLSEPTIDPPAGVATIVSIGEDGTVTQIFDSWAHERDVNPYGLVYHAHPFGLLAGPDGRLWVADAGANALMAIDPASGEAEVVSIFDPLPGVFPRPEYDNEMLTDPVPTAVALTDDGLFVSLLSGAPFVPGSAKVLAIGEDGSATDYATGLTMLTDMRAAPDGTLYATQFGLWGEMGPAPGTGSVVRIGEGESSSVVLSGLTFPTSLDFDADGNLYVTANGVGAPGSGQVLMFEGVGDIEGMPVAEMLAAMAPPAEEMADAEGAESAVGAEEGDAEVLQTIDDYLQAFASQDGDTLEALTAEPFTAVESDGAVVGREEWIALGSDNSIEELTASNVALTTLADGVVFALFDLDGVGSDDEGEYAIEEITSVVLVAAEDGWHIATVHNTVRGADGDSMDDAGAMDDTGDMEEMAHGDLTVLTVDVAAEGIVVAEEVSAGPTVIELVNSAGSVDAEGAPVLAVVGRVLEGSSLEDALAAAMAANDDPVPALSMMGIYGIPIFPGGQLVYDLQPGQHIAFTLETGEAVPFMVVDGGDGTAAAPEADVVVEMADFAFVMPDTLAAGPQLWEFANSGEQWHEVIAVKWADGATEEEVMAALMSEEEVENPPFEMAYGYAAITPGERAWHDVDLEAGTYTFLCFLPDIAGDFSPHFAHGMTKMVTVE